MALHTSLHKRQQTTPRIFRRALTMLLCLTIFQFELIFIIKYLMSQNILDDVLINTVFFHSHMNLIHHINEMK